jgi:hypothetical protein
MYGEIVQAAGGFTVGDVVRLSCEPGSARVAQVMVSHVMVEWPWRRIDPDARRVRWNGTVGLPRLPEHPDWGHSPWRTDPDVGGLREGDVCSVGIPPVQVRVSGIRRFDPPMPLGWLPHTALALGLVLSGHEGDPEGGFSVYLPSAEPYVIEHVDAAG